MSEGDAGSGFGGKEKGREGKRREGLTGTSLLPPRSRVHQGQQALLELLGVLGLLVLYYLSEKGWFHGTLRLEGEPQKQTNKQRIAAYLADLSELGLG